MAKGVAVLHVAEQFSASPETRQYLAKAPVMWGKVLGQVMEVSRELAGGRRIAFEAHTFMDNLAGRRVERLDFAIRVDASPENAAEFSALLFQRLDYGKIHEQTKERLLAYVLPLR
jgi:hypothetical protein